MRLTPTLSFKGMICIFRFMGSVLGVRGRLLDAFGELELPGMISGLVARLGPLDRDIADFLEQEAEFDVASLALGHRL